MLKDDFAEVYSGLLYGVMEWSSLKKILEDLYGDDWFVYDIRQGLPTLPLQEVELKKFTTNIFVLLTAEHEEDYCGIVYVDDLSSPKFIKIYDPQNLGTSCGINKSKINPGWVLSKMPPSKIDFKDPVPQNRIKWWRKIFGI